jgi:uncharacterized protein (DUF2267 family)
MEDYTQNNKIDHGKKTRPLNFEKYAAEGNHFIKAVSMELQIPRNNAARITRAVLHAVRDRIPPIDAIQFAQGLPMALKAVFIDQYNISITPLKLRNTSDFLGYIYFKDGPSAERDFPNEDALIDALKGVFLVLEDYMDHGQVAQVKRLLGRDIYELIDTYQVYYPN